MLNYLWGGMILIGIIVSALNGRLPDVTTNIIGSSDETIQIILKLAGTVCMWSGLMKVAEKSGLVESLSKKMRPILKYLFPDIPKNHKSLDYIATNMIANILGLGWAATPAGLVAMEELQKLNKDKKTASKSMCMFMIINMSSLQLITVNILSYRTAYGSTNPAEILAPGILATLVSTIAGVLYAKFKERWG
ncbi:MAG: nucleoside recognition protein [Clostridiales bacterium]|jgi:spore maturation protein A|nr:nucleoside recognition protein [Clostridiales bacterium]